MRISNEHSLNGTNGSSALQPRVDLGRTKAATTPPKKVRRGKRCKRPVVPVTSAKPVNELAQQSLTMSPIAPPDKTDGPLSHPPVLTISAEGILEGMDRREGSDPSNEDKDGCLGDGLVLKSHENYYASQENVKELEAGGVLFSFTCRRALDPYEAELAECVANLSSFEDETRDNYVPHFDYHDENGGGGTQYTYFLVKGAYLLPPVDLEALADPKFLARAEYHEACEPGETVVWKDRKDCDDTFRITKPIVPHMYSITVQFKVSRIRNADLAKLSKLVGVPVECGLLLERTKRSKPPKQDATRKAKSVLLYTRTGVEGGGILVNHVTVVLQSSLPGIVERVIDKFDSWGLAETVETVSKTRTYLRKSIPV